MENLIQVADEFKKFANRFKPMVALAEKLEQIGSIEQAEKEALQRLDSVKKELDEICQIIIKKNTEIFDLGEGIQEIKKQGEDIIAKARTDASECIIQAKVQAARISEEIKNSKDDWESSVQSRKKVLIDLDSIITQKSGQIKALEDQFADLKSKLAGILKA